MIDVAIRLLESELEIYLKDLFGGPSGEGDGGYVTAGNIAMTESDGAEVLNGQIVMTVVNLEEESTFKNLPNYSKTLNGGVRYENAPLHLNLYLLFSANFSPNKYITALQRLSGVIQFFQGKRVFNLKNSPTFNIDGQTEAMDMKIILDLYTLTFEQINHLWGSLGGKQMPFVMYKSRLVQITDRRQTEGGILIEEITERENANAITI